MTDRLRAKRYLLAGVIFLFVSLVGRVSGWFLGILLDMHLPGDSPIGRLNQLLFELGLVGACFVVSVGALYWIQGNRRAK